MLLWFDAFVSKAHTNVVLDFIHEELFGLWREGITNDKRWWGQTYFALMLLGKQEDCASSSSLNRFHVDFNYIWLCIYFCRSITIYLCHIMQNLIWPSATCSWVNVFVYPGTTLLLSNQIWTSVSFFVKFRLIISVCFLCISVIHLSSIPLILEITHR